MLHSLKTATLLAAGLIIPNALAVVLPHAETCAKYLDLAIEAADALQERYFTAEGDYGPQAVWISGVDTIYLNKCDLFPQHVIPISFLSFA